MNVQNIIMLSRSSSVVVLKLFHTKTTYNNLITCTVNSFSFRILVAWNTPVVYHYVSVKYSDQ